MGAASPSTGSAASSTASRAAEFVLSTKVGRVLRAPRNPERFDQGFWSGGLQFDHVFDYSYDAIMRAYEDCLQRLGMNRIDLLVIHDLDFWHHATEPKVQAYLGQLIGGGWRALEELRSGGQIKAIGAGINELGMMPRFLDLFDLDFFLVALRYTLMEHDTLDGELPYCERRDVGIIIGGVFSSGRHRDRGRARAPSTTMPTRRPRCWTRSRRIQAVCERHGVPLQAAALQFPFGHPSVASVIPGAIRPDQVDGQSRLFPPRHSDRLLAGAAARAPDPRGCARCRKLEARSHHGPDHARRGPRLRLRGAGPRAARARRCRRRQSRVSARAAACPAPATPSPSTAATGRVAPT